MNKKQALIGIVLLTLFFASAAHADIGQHPYISVQVKKDGKKLEEPYIICMDSFMSGAQELMDQDTFCDHKYVQELQSRHEEEIYPSCMHSKNQFSSGAYEPPSRIAIIYPVHGRVIGECAKEEVNAQIYESEELSSRPTELMGSNHFYKAEIDTEDNSLEVHSVQTGRTLNYILQFTFFLLATLVIELVVAFGYLKWREKPLKVLFGVAAGNILSFPLLTVVPIVITGSLITSLVLGEIFVIPFEALVIKVFNRNRLSAKHSLLLSILINFISFLTGEAIYFFLMI